MGESIIGADKESPVKKKQVKKGEKNEMAKENVLLALKELGVDGDASKDYDDLVQDLISHSTRVHNSFVDKTAKQLKSKLDFIKKMTNLRDDAFISRLISLGIHDFYLCPIQKGNLTFFIFTDDDAHLSDRDIWSKIRASGVNPIATNDIFTRKFKRGSSAP